jgi:acyl carrier protein
MLDTELRRTLVMLLRQANIGTLRDGDLEAAFIAGTIDMAIEDLGMDSLAAMELCIGMEVSLGSDLVPDDLWRLGRLSALVAALRAKP